MPEYKRRGLCPFFLFLMLSPLSFVTGLSGVQAQETNIFQHPNSEQAGIKKSLEQQIGAGRGDINTPDSSLYIISRDPFRSIRRGRNLFQRKFTISQGMGPRNGDGFGDISANASLGAGLTDSCAACHGRPRSSAGFGGDVFARPDSGDAPHLFGLGIIELLADEIAQDLRQTRDQAIARAKGGRGSVEVSLSKAPDFQLPFFSLLWLFASSLIVTSSNTMLRVYFEQGRPTITTTGMREELEEGFSCRQECPEL